MGKLGNFIDRILNKFSAKQISWVVILVSYLAVVLCVSFIVVTTHKYSLDDFNYSYNEMEVGVVEDGPESHFSYGPYTNLKSGNWKIEIEYESEYDQGFDIIAKKNTGANFTITAGDLPKNKQLVSKVFNVENAITNDTLEYRTDYSGEGRFELKNVKVSRTFVFKWYLVVTLITIIVSIAVFLGKDFFKMTQSPKKTIYFSLFYMILAFVCVWTMVNLPKQEGEAIYIVMNVFVVLHSWGFKKEIYKYFTRKNVLVVLGYIYMIGSYYALDIILRNITNEATDLTFASYEPNLFTFAIIGVVVLFISILPKRWMKRTLYGITYFLCLILLAVQTVYYQVFDKLFSFKDIKLAKEGSDYTDYVVGLLDSDFITAAVILILAGIIGILIISKSFRIQKEWYLIIISVVASIIIYSQTIYSGEYGAWDSFNNPSYIYSTFSNRVGAFKLCGFYQYELRDFYLAMFGNNADNKKLKKEVDEYFKEKEVVAENEFTGLFKDKNVIFVLMESIDDVAIREDVMPTLYRMSQQGISFTNMYSSIYGSAATLNAEMVTNIGLYAPTDGSLVYSFADNYFPYSLANRFTQKGYSARQYHFNEAEYYSRNLLNTTFGYKEYVCYQDYAKNNYLIDDVIAKNDDLYKTLVQDDKFFDYVISYSAHLTYDSSESSVKTALELHPEYASLTSSEEINNYFAKARLTDDMFTELIAKLRSSGDLEDTVIVAVGDHYPYGIEDEKTLFELSNVEEYTPLLYKTPFIIWTPGISNYGVSNMAVDKVCSSIDIVPTLVNLFELGDTEVYVGHDILDDEYEGRAYFEDGSWIVKDTYYRNGSKVYGSLSKEEIDVINKEILDTITINDNILHSDYYR